MVRLFDIEPCDRLVLRLRCTVPVARFAHSDGWILILTQSS